MNITLINDTSSDFHHGSKIVIDHINFLVKKFNGKIIKSIFVGKRFSFTDIPTDTTIVIVNGEGTLHHDNFRSKNLISDLKNVFENTEMPIYLINASLYSNSIALYKFFYIFKKIYVRDSYSKKELYRYKINSTVCPDLTFFQANTQKHSKKRKHFYIITDSVDRDMSNNLLLAHSKNKKNSIYLPLIFDSKISFFKQIRNAIFILLWVLFKINIHEKYIKHFFMNKNTREVINAISSSSGVITARYHAVCISLKTLTPFICFGSNTNKIESLLNDIGLHKRCYKVKKNTFEVINNESLLFSQKQINLIEAFNINASRKILKMFSTILSG